MTAQQLRLAQGTVEVSSLPQQKENDMRRTILGILILAATIGLASPAAATDDTTTTTLAPVFSPIVGCKDGDEFIIDTPVLMERFIDNGGALGECPLPDPVFHPIVGCKDGDEFIIDTPVLMSRFIDNGGTLGNCPLPEVAVADPPVPPVTLADGQDAIPTALAVDDLATELPATGTTLNLAIAALVILALGAAAYLLAQRRQ